MPRDKNIGSGVTLIVPGKNDTVLMSQRIHTPKDSEIMALSEEFPWQFPGGWIDAGETHVEAAKRELFEETGLILLDATEVDNVWRWSQHYSNTWVNTTFFIASTWEGTPERKEPDKSGPWEWVPVNKLRELPLFFDEYVTVLEDLQWL